MSFTPITVFEKYEVIRRLAMGGMGEIFLARQKGVAGFERLVILKSLLPDLAKDKELVQQFLDEARIAATLNHPNIVGIYELGDSGGVYFLAMEYIAGESFADLVRAARENKVGVPWHVSVALARDTATGLDHAHFAVNAKGEALNIIHRDVTPQNIMVRLDGVVKVLDFGIAKSAASASRTSAGEVKGKLQYMAPEQIRGEPFDHRSDQFSLGVVLWEMATGKRLFSGESPVEIFRKILTHDVALPTSFIPKFPKDLEVIIMRMLEDKPDARYARCKEAAAALTLWLERNNAPAGGVSAFVEEQVGENVRERAKKLQPEPTIILGMSQNLCPSCATTNKKGAKFCAECGVALDGSGRLGTGHTPVPPASVLSSAQHTAPFALPPNTLPEPNLGTISQNNSSISHSSSLPQKAPVEVDLDELFGESSSQSKNQNTLQSTAKIQQQLSTQTPPQARSLSAAIRIKNDAPFLLGRDAHLKRLKEVFSDLSAPRSLLFTGEAGIGKSTLLRWARFHAWSQGWAVVEVQGNAFGESAHLDGVRQIMRQLSAFRSGRNPSDVNSPELLEQVSVDARWHKRLQKVLLGKDVSDLYDDSDLDDLAIAHLLKASAGPEGLCILVDDLHQSDRLTQRVLSALAKLTNEIKLMLICTSRHKAKLAKTEHHELKALDDDSILRLIRHDFGNGGIPRTGAQQILTTVKGNPFFANELMKFLIDRRLISPVQGVFMANEELGHFKLPHGVNFLISSRFRALDSSTRRLLLYGAVAGHSFNLDAVLWGASLGEEVSAALFEAKKTGFLQELPAVDSQERFSCASMREIILGLSYVVEVQKAHRALASALEQQIFEENDIVIVDQMARHHLAGAPEHASKALTQAAVLMQKHGDLQGAATYYPAIIGAQLDEAAQKIREENLNSEEIALLFKEAETASFAMEAQPLDALHLLSRVLKLIPDDKLVDKRIALYRRQAQLRMQIEQYSEAESTLESALECADDISALLRAEILADFAEIMARNKNFEGARAQLIDALRSVPQNELNSEFLGKQMYLLGDLFWRLGNKKQARISLLRAQGFTQQTKDCAAQVQVALKLADCEAGSGNMGAAQECLTAGIALSTACGDEHSRVKMQVKLAQYLMAQGKLTEAQKCFSEAKIGAEAIAWSAGLASINRALASLPSSE